MKNKEGTVTFVDQYWKQLSPEARDITEKMVAKDPAERITAAKALKHPWFSMEHSGSTGLATAQENMRKYNDKNRFNMEKIKPEFSIVTCSPLLGARGAIGVNSPCLGPAARKQFVAQSPMPLPSKLVQNDAKAAEESKKVMKGGLLIRSLHNKAAAAVAEGRPTKPIKQSSFKKSEIAAEPAEEEDFKDEDIDEQPEPDTFAKSAAAATRGGNEDESHKAPAQHKAFVPRILEDRKLPPTPGFHNTNAFRYVASGLATPMQNRRPIFKKKQPDASPTRDSYFKRLAAASTSTTTGTSPAPCPSAEPSPPTVPPASTPVPGKVLLPSRNDLEFQTAMSHPDVDSTVAASGTKKAEGKDEPEVGVKGDVVATSVEKTKNLLKEII